MRCEESMVVRLDPTELDSICRATRTPLLDHSRIETELWVRRRSGDRPPVLSSDGDIERLRRHWFRGESR